MRRSKRSSPSDGIPLDDDFRPTTCPNCGTERRGRYCHECGQRYLKARLDAAELWWIFADRFLDWEEGVWRTFLKMGRAPGSVIRHYLGGKRKTYLNPFSYLLMCVLLYSAGQFVLRRIAGIGGVPGVERVQSLSSAAINVEDESRLIAYGTVLVVTLLAISMRVIFDGRLLNAMEAVVTALYASGNVFLLTLVLSIVEFVISGHPLPLMGLLIAFLVLFPICMGHAGYGLFEGWTMVGYTAVAPVMASLMGGMFFYAFAGIVTSFFGQGVIVPIVGSIIFLTGPLFILGLYLFGILG